MTFARKWIAVHLRDITATARIMMRLKNRIASDKNALHNTRMPLERKAKEVMQDEGCVVLTFCVRRKELYNIHETGRLTGSTFTRGQLR